MPNFQHHFDAAGCVALLRRARGALAPGGLVLAPEFVAEEDRPGPSLAVMFAFIMLATTPAATVYTPGELARIFAEAGFGRAVEFAPLGQTPQTLVVGRP